MHESFIIKQIDLLLTAQVLKVQNLKKLFKKFQFKNKLFLPKFIKRTSFHVQLLFPFFNDILPKTFQNIKKNLRVKTFSKLFHIMPSSEL